MIEEALDSRETKVTWKDIADAAGLTKGALSNFRKGAELGYTHLLSIAKFLFEKDHTATFKKWCLNFRRPSNLKYALDYLAVNRQVAELEELIQKINEEQTNKELLDWANGYSLLAMYLNGEDYAEVLNQIRLYTPKTLEMKVLVVITEVWCRNKMREYGTMNSLVSGLELSIKEIEDEAIRESYEMQLKEALAYVQLYKFNNAELARKYANEIISANLSAAFDTNASYLLGMSYLFDNYDECLGNILKHRELLKETGRHNEIRIVDNNDVPFIKNVWKKHTEQPKTNDISERAHYEALVGNKDLAVELVNRSIEEDEASGFKLYYKALATNEKSLFMESFIFFIKKGDKFFANLPYEHLKGDPVYQPMADLLFVD